MHFHRVIEQILPRKQEHSKQRSNAPASESVCPSHRQPNRDEDVMLISVRFGHIGFPKPNRYHPDFGSLRNRRRSLSLGLVCLFTERPNQDGGWTRGPDSTKRTQLRERPNSRQEGPGQEPVQHGIQHVSHHRGASLEKDMCAVTQYSRLKR